MVLIKTFPNNANNNEIVNMKQNFKSSLNKEQTSDIKHNEAENGIIKLVKRNVLSKFIKGIKEAENDRAMGRLFRKSLPYLVGFVVLIMIAVFLWIFYKRKWFINENIWNKKKKLTTKLFIQNFIALP